jgi:LPXTG-motif cell wall-anchored protein
VGWAECKNNASGTAADCDTTNTGSAIPDASGAFSTQFTVHRILHTANGTVDCASAPETCNLGAGTVTQPSAERAGAPITFDPNAPLPPPPTLEVNPTIGLHDGASIAVSGSDYLPSAQVAIVQCSVPASASTCQTLSLLPADATGSFTTQVTVHRIVATPPFGATDCADAPGRCQLTAVSLPDYYDYAAHVDLAFDPGGPPPPGQVTVTPDTDLVQFQSVSLAGSGFNPSGGVQIVECRADATSPADCLQGSSFVPTSPTGTFATPVVVRRILHLESGDFDCASSPGACALVSSSFGASTVVVVSPVSFDPGAPVPPPPSISVVPDTDLTPGQSVTVTGANFAPSSPVGVGECLSGAQIFGPCGPGLQVAISDANGAFTKTLTVGRGVVDFGSFPPQVVDCAESSGRCSVVASSSDGQDHAAHALDFDASVPIPVPDTNVSPQFDLPDRALVHVHSTGFAPGEHVVVSECAAGAADVFACGNGLIGGLVADGSGVVDTTIRVRRDIVTPQGFLVIDDLGGTTNCAVAVGTCVVRVQSLDDPLVISDVPIGFDPTAIAPPPTVSITPAGPYADGQQVVVHGEGFTPRAALGMAECASGVEPGPTTCDRSEESRFAWTPVDADGTVTHTLTLHTTIETTDGSIDCSVPDACVLFVASINDFNGERASVPLDFGGVGGVQVFAAPRALAFTGAGSDTVPAVVIGVALVLLGGALVLLSRRRRARAG